MRQEVRVETRVIRLDFEDVDCAGKFVLTKASFSPLPDFGYGASVCKSVEYAVKLARGSPVIYLLRKGWT